MSRQSAGALGGQPRACLDRAESLPVRTSSVSCGWNGKDGNVSENQLDNADQSEKKAAVLSATEAIALIFRRANDDEETEAHGGSVGADEPSSSES